MRTGADEDADAPRRLYYVAMTRARRTLVLARFDRGHVLADALPDSPALLSGQVIINLPNFLKNFGFSLREIRTWVGHEVTIELPMLAENSRVFTPTERGVMEIAAYPTFQGLPYAAMGWETGQSWVLPLVSVLDPGSDHAITIALPADANIPHLQFDWCDGKTLRMTLAHRGMGGGQPSPLTLLMFAHPADYRAAIRAYSDAFPSYFRSPSAARALRGHVLVSPHPRSPGAGRDGPAERALYLVELLVHAPGRVPARRSGVGAVHLRQVVEAGPDDERREDPGVRPRDARAGDRHVRLFQRDRIRRCRRQDGRHRRGRPDPPREVRQCPGQGRARQRYPDVGRGDGDEPRQRVFAVALPRRPGPPPSHPPAGDRRLRDRPAGLGQRSSITRTTTA